MFTVQRLVSDLYGTWLVLQVVALSVTVARVMPARTTEIKLFINIRYSTVQKAKLKDVQNCFFPSVVGCFSVVVWCVFLFCLGFLFILVFLKAAHICVFLYCLLHTVLEK